MLVKHLGALRDTIDPNGRISDLGGAGHTSSMTRHTAAVINGGTIGIGHHRRQAKQRRADKNESFFH